MRPSVALEQHRDNIPALAERFTLLNVRVFGSVARGEDGDDSDLDLLVDITPDVTSLFELVDFKEEVEKLLGVSVDVRTLEDIHERFRANVLRDARPL